MTTLTLTALGLLLFALAAWWIVEYCSGGDDR